MPRTFLSKVHRSQRGQISSESTGTTLESGSAPLLSIYERLNGHRLLSFVRMEYMFVTTMGANSACKRVGGLGNDIYVAKTRTAV